MSDKPTILFIHSGASSFVKEDLRILHSMAEVKVFHFEASKSAVTLGKNFFKQVIWLLQNMHSADLIYSWFSDYHSFLPTLLSKWLRIPSITILGGFDCNYMPSLNYGIFCSAWRSVLGKYILQHSSLLLPVDKTLIHTSPISGYWGEAHPNGVSANVPFFSNNWEAVSTGYDAKAWAPGPEHREKTVCTAALCSNHRTALIKGWDLFFETSKLLPDYNFIVVGGTPEFIQELQITYKPGNNVEFIPPVARQELEAIYHRSSVYVQLSRAEGLPNVLCEAMMCGCVPVGSPVFGIPHGIGEAGFVAQKPDPAEISELIEQAHEAASTLRVKARKQISEEFSLQQRETTLREIISEVV